MSNNSSQVGTIGRESHRTGTLRLHERIGQDLKERFGGQIVEHKLPNFSPDCVIHNDDRIAVIDISTGDPTLPLPASANTRMLNLKDGAAKLGLPGVVVPVLVTNYLIDDADRQELESGGIKIVRVLGPSYNSKALSDQLEGIIARA
jgi:hypothetical protein